MLNAAVQPSAVSGAIAARATTGTRKRHRPTEPAAATPIEPGPPPSPSMSRTRDVIRFALDAERPIAERAAARWMCRKIAALELSIYELRDVTDILVRIVEDGPRYQHALGPQFRPEEVEKRIVPAMGVTKRVYWEGALCSLEACLSYAGGLRMKDAHGAMARMDIIFSWPALLPKAERDAVSKRLSADVRKLLNGRL